YTNGGFGSAVVSFTPPAALVPAGLHVEQRAGQYVVAWSSVAGATMYQIYETWMETTATTVRTPDGRSSTSTEYRPQSNIITTSQTFVPLLQGGGTTTVSSSTDRTISRSLSSIRYEVAAAYPPSGVTAPRAQWPHLNVP